MSEMTPADNAQMMIHLSYVKDTLGKIEHLLKALPQMNNDIGQIKTLLADHTAQLARLFEKSDAADVAIDQARADGGKAISFVRCVVGGLYWLPWPSRTRRLSLERRD